MKKTARMGTVTLLAIALCFGVAYAQQPSSGSSSQGNPPEQGGWYCPYAGGMMGPGMMGRSTGPGMTQQGGVMGPGMMMGRGYGYGPRYQQPEKPLEKKDAEAMVQNYLDSTRNPNLKLGKVKDEGSTFEAEIVTKDGSLADKILVDKNTGWMRSSY